MSGFSSLLHEQRCEFSEKCLANYAGEFLQVSMHFCLHERPHPLADCVPRALLVFCMDRLRVSQWCFLTDCALPIRMCCVDSSGTLSLQPGKEESSGAKRKQDTHAYRVWLSACRARMGKKRGGEAVMRSPCRLSPCRPLAVSNPLYCQDWRVGIFQLVLMS